MLFDRLFFASGVVEPCDCPTVLNILPLLPMVKPLLTGTEHASKLGRGRKKIGFREPLLVYGGLGISLGCFSRCSLTVSLMSRP